MSFRLPFLFSRDISCFVVLWQNGEVNEVSNENHIFMRSIKGILNLKDLATSLSLSNLLYINIWRDVFIATPESHYYQWSFREALSYIHIIAGVTLLGFLLFLLVSILKTHHYVSLVKWLRLSILFLFLNAIRHHTNTLIVGTKSQYTYVIISLIVFILLISIVAVFYRKPVLHNFIESVLIISLPFYFLNSGRALFVGYRLMSSNVSASSYASSNPNYASFPKPTIRLVIIVFDSLDLNAFYHGSTNDLPLEQFNVLKTSSLFAMNAYPPSAHTEESIPALATGSVSLTPPKGRIYPSIFSDATSLRLKTAITGWVLDYHLWFGQDAYLCSWLPHGQPLSGYLSDDTIYQAIALSENLPLVARLGLHNRMNVARPVFPTARWHAEQTKRIISTAMDYLGNEDLGLIFLHMPIPHLPCIYSREKNDYSPGINCSYLDNLALVDLTIKRFFDEVDRTGLSENTVMIITGDHWHRERAGIEGRIVGDLERRVPFIVRFPGNVENIRYQKTFVTTALPGLAIRILEKKIVSAIQIAEWLDKQEQQRTK